MADTTTTTGPSAAADFTMAAARRMHSASPTEVPQNFMTRSDEIIPDHPSDSDTVVFAAEANRASLRLAAGPQGPLAAILSTLCPHGSFLAAASSLGVPRPRRRPPAG